MRSGFTGRGTIVTDGDPHHDAYHVMPESLRLVAQGDFTQFADRFIKAGLRVSFPAPGIVRISPASHSVQRASLLVSVGVHGDETGPIEMLAQLLDELAIAPAALKVDLMLVVGNPAAIAQGKRFIDVDMNRLFRLAREGETSLKVSAENPILEAGRAKIIMQATADFFAAAQTEKWHLDLHTTIRPSRYPTFAIVPDLIASSEKSALMNWLSEARIGAVIMNPTSSGTYSYYTAEHFGAASSTVELGRIGVLGGSDSSLLAQPKAALRKMMSGELFFDAHDNSPHVFEVTQEIIKHSNAFTMAFDRATENFTPMQRDTVIATDGDVVYRVCHTEESVVFPNPDVSVGHRAGLMVVRQYY